MMIAGIVSFFTGILLLQQVPDLPDIIWCWGLFLILIIPILSRYYAYILFCIFGFLWALLRAHWVLDAGLPGEFQGVDLLATGVISSIPLDEENKRRFDFDIESLEYQQVKIASPGKVRLNWYLNQRQSNSVFKYQAPGIKAGQRWQFWLRLKQPHGFMNPGGFDYEGWLYQNKIRATGYVRINAKKHQLATKLNDRVSGYTLLILRQSIHDNIRFSTQASKFGGLLEALAIGERSGISQEQWQVFRNTGTSHLVAISGLHIGLFAGFVYFLLLYLWPYIPGAALKLASPRAAALISLLAAFFYAALSGFAVPAQRALIMITVVMLSIYRMQKIQSTHILSLALLGVLLFDPNAVLAPGFWLSFVAVAIISLAASARIHHDNKLLLWGQLQWRISIVMIPLLLFLFQQASLISPLANFVAIPVISFIIVPLVLVSTFILSIFPDLSVTLYAIADHFIAALWWILQELSYISWSQWVSSQPGLLSLILASLGLALLLTPKGWPMKYLGVFMLLPLFFAHSASIHPNQAKVNLLDVGQGLALVIQTQHHSLVFDTGPKFNDDFDTGSAVLIPFLHQQGIKKLDMVVLSHQDNDHRGGYTSVKNSIAPLRVLSSYGEAGSEACEAGQSWQWDGVRFEMLNPEVSHPEVKRNNAACVLRVSAGDDVVLLTADIEAKAEKRLTEARPEQLRARYLVVPHHGSKTSSSELFLNAVRPEYALFPVGYRNRYQMPHAVVLQRYELNKSKIFMTSSSGCISFIIGEKSSNQEPIEYRKSAQKYWNSRH